MGFGMFKNILKFNYEHGQMYSSTFEIVNLVVCDWCPIFLVMKPRIYYIYKAYNPPKNIALVQRASTWSTYFFCSNNIEFVSHLSPSNLALKILRIWFRNSRNCKFWTSEKFQNIFKSSKIPHCSKIRFHLHSFA